MGILLRSLPPIGGRLHDEGIGTMGCLFKVVLCTIV